MEKRTAELLVHAYACLVWIIGIWLAVFFIWMYGIDNQAVGLVQLGRIFGTILITLAIGSTFYYLGASIWYRMRLSYLFALITFLLLALLGAFFTLAVAQYGSDGAHVLLICSALLTCVSAYGVYLFGFNRDVKALFTTSTGEPAKPVAKA